ncbi:MAG TPA: SCO family protein [Pyrinomonadaceae bacterium]|nr:SCO family protein [Pyrinomonadaceae bacterium]
MLKPKAKLSRAAGACAALLITLAVAPAAAQHDGHGRDGHGAPAAPAASTTAATAPTAPTGAAGEGAAFVCPMHPEVTSKEKGSCPKCGMHLREKAAETKETAAAAAASAPGAAGARKMSIPDVELLDQDGRKVRFYSDLVRGRTVAVNFIFTTCTTVCPPLGATFARVQRELGERAGRDVHLISVSVDPAVDTPERLKAWGEKFKAGPGWTFVTGPKSQVDELLRALAASTARPEDHTPTVLVGNEAAGQWTRAYGLARPSQLIEIINQAAAGRLEPGPRPAGPGVTKQ